MTAPIAPSLVPPQLAILQKAPEPAPVSSAAGTSAPPRPPPAATGRGRLLDIVV